MSIKVNITHVNIEELTQKCTVVGAPSDYGPSETVVTLAQTKTSVLIPFSLAREMGFQAPKQDAFPKATTTFKKAEYPFRTDGGRDQEIVFNQALEHLEKSKSVLLSLFCGFGKTMLGIRIACEIGLKTAILTHRSKLTDQWVESINKFCTDSKIQLVESDGLLDPAADFYIFNIAMVSKKWEPKSKKWIPRGLGAFKEIGFLIVDEGHIIGAEKMAESLFYFCPAAVCCLTATPIRKDGMDRILELYFGGFNKTRIIRIAQNPFTVCKVTTGIKPEFTLNTMGRKDWNSVINYLSKSLERNQLIIDIVVRHPKKTFLILTKLKFHCNILAKMLGVKGITSTIMVGAAKNYSKTATVLLSTYSKLGVGFDDSRLDTLILAMSITEVEQFAGRLRDEPGKERIIFDLVDADSNCIKHWQERRKWYLSRKGVIKKDTTEPVEIQGPGAEYVRLAKSSKT